MKNLLFICSIMLLATPSFSQKRFQPGYVINLDGDTLKGIIEYGNWDKNPKAVSFKDALSSKPGIYRPDQIRGFLVNNEFYQSAIVDVDTSAHKMTELDDSPAPKYRKDTVFLFSLVRGNRSLYFLKDGNSKSHFFIDDDGFKPLIFKEYVQSIYDPLRYGYKKVIFYNKEYLSQLSIYLKDCEHIQSYMAQLSYDVPSLIGLFNQYYSCTGRSAKHINRRKEIKLQAGILAGASIADLTYWDRNMPKSFSQQSNTFSAGLFLDWKLLRTNGLDFAQSFYITGFNVQDTGYRLRTTTLDTVSYSLNFTHFKTTHQLRFNLFKNSGLYISAGFSIGRMNEKKESTARNYAYTSTTEYSQSASTVIGEVGTLGYRIGRLSAEASFERQPLPGASIIYWKHLFLKYRIL